MSGESILVVEDETLVAMEIKEDLLAQGYRVPAVVSRGDDALEAVIRHRPDLVLMDIRIKGGMDGIEAARRIKEATGLPILYLTANSDEATLARAAITEPEAFLLKPFNERELVANIRMALARIRSRTLESRTLEGSLPLVNVMAFPALVADRQGRIVHCNGLARSLLDGTGGGLEGRFLDDLVAQSDVASEGQAREFSTIKALDGSRPLAFVHREPLKGRDGRYLGSLVTFDRMSRNERFHIETSVEAINAAMAAILPGEATDLPGFAAAAFLDPCVSGAGDLVEAFPLRASLSAFLGLDVMGHGTFSSLVAYSTRGLVRELLRSTGDGGPPSPARLVSLLNESYANESEGKPFFTMVFGILDGEDGSWRLVRAGHPPVLVLPRAGPGRVVDSRGGALGVLSQMDVEEASGRLELGDRLVVMSDGYLEAAGGIDLGVAVGIVQSFMAAHRSEGLGDFVRSLRDLAMGGLPAAVLKDDVSLLVIERLAPPPV